MSLSCLDIDMRLCALAITDIDNDSSYRSVADIHPYALQSERKLHCIYTLRVALPTH